MPRTLVGVLVLVILAGCGGGEHALVSESQIVGDAIPASLTGRPGDAERGREVFLDREGAHCLLCHVVDGLDAPFQGNLGPSLTGIGDRLSTGQLRLQVVDAGRVWPGTIMPSYHKVDGLVQVGSSYEGRPALSAEEVEDLVAYLATFTEDGE